MDPSILAEQQRINARGYRPRLVEDGVDGPRTRAGRAWLARQGADPWADAVPGVDVSGHQRDIDGAQIRAAGYLWGIVKATEGVAYLSRRHGPQQLRQMRDHGIILAGLYHFPGRASLAGRVCGTPEQEAAHYLAGVETLGGLPPGARPILDIEGCDYRHSANQAVRWWCEWIRIVAEKTGRVVLRYSNAPYLWAHARTAAEDLRRELADGPLWWAEYGTRRTVLTAPAKDPTPWRPEQIEIHQYEGRRGYPATRVPGVAKACDVNRMRRDVFDRLAAEQAGL